jgi:hypothetical protein
MTRHAAFAARFTRFFRRPLVRRALLMCGTSTFARNFTLLLGGHRGKPATFLALTRYISALH